MCKKLEDDTKGGGGRRKIFFSKFPALNGNLSTYSYWAAVNFVKNFSSRLSRAWVGGRGSFLKVATVGQP